MASTDVELEKQLKEAGKQLLLHPPDSVDELLPVLDKVEKLLSNVDQAPEKSMLDALEPSMKALIQDSLSKHSDVDVKVAVASCISEITRITVPDAPYDDDQMRDVFELIVSSFEGLADQSSRSYNKRASILETVSRVRSCVIMLDLECDELIVEMFEHFLKSVRDYHLDSIFPYMESIMVLVLEESEEIPVQMLTPLLASVKKDNAGVLPIARKLGKGVFLKSADKLKPYLIPALNSLGETLDMYTRVVTSICEGQAADESNLTTASSDHTGQVVEEDASPEESIMSNGVSEAGNEGASVDQESKKPEEDIHQQPPYNEGLTREDPPEDQKGAGKKTETPVTSAKRKRTTGKDNVSVEYDESVVGKKVVDVGRPVVEGYYEELYPTSKKKHQISSTQQGKVEASDGRLMKLELELAEAKKALEMVSQRTDAIEVRVAAVQQQVITFCVMMISSLVHAAVVAQFPR